MEVVIDGFELLEIFNSSYLLEEFENVKVGAKYAITYHNKKATMTIIGISFGSNDDDLYTVKIDFIEPAKVERETIILELTFINGIVNDFIQDCVSDNCVESTQDTLKEIEKIKQDLRKVYKKVLG